MPGKAAAEGGNIWIKDARLNPADANPFIFLALIG
jgi:hypothetical protein